MVGGLIRFSSSIRSAGYGTLKASDTKSVFPAMAWKFASTLAWPSSEVLAYRMRLNL